MRHVKENAQVASAKQSLDQPDACFFILVRAPGHFRRNRRPADDRRIGRPFATLTHNHAPLVKSSC